MNLNSAVRFPYDVLREIVLHAHIYTFKPGRDDPNILLQLPSPPIVASHVCRSWRYSLLSDTSMWTCLLIPQMKPDGILELLRRSGSAPLNVFLKLEHSRELEHENVSHMLFSLFQQIHRFRLLYVYVYPCILVPYIHRFGKYCDTFSDPRRNCSSSHIPISIFLSKTHS